MGLVSIWMGDRLGTSDIVNKKLNDSDQLYNKKETKKNSTDPKNANHTIHTQKAHKKLKRQRKARQQKLSMYIKTLIIQNTHAKKHISN